MVTPPVVFLFHGTWAFGFWRTMLSRFPSLQDFHLLLPSGRIRTATSRDNLSDPLPQGSRLVSFDWTGYNGQRARSDAASELARRLVNEAGAFDVPLFVIAHMADLLDGGERLAGHALCEGNVSEKSAIPSRGCRALPSA